MIKYHPVFELPRLVLIVSILFKSCLPSEHPEFRSDIRSIDPDIQKAIDDFVTNVYFPASKISKLGLAIVKNNSEILYSTGYGMADQEKGILNGNQTQFFIGSVTKSFTATIVVKLLHERFPEMGETVLDTPVMKLVSSPINFTLNDRFRSEYFTFRDLLAHRMCIHRNDLQLYTEPFPETSDIVYRQRYAKGECGMRSEFRYNNQMYVIAGELAGIIANKSYTELMNELFAEIGMHNSSLANKSDDFSKMPFRSHPYYVRNATSYPMNPELVTKVVVNNAAGGLAVPPNDMIKYMNFHLNKGKVNGKQVIPQDVMSWLTKPSIHFRRIAYRSSDDGPFVHAFGYGLGMIVGSYDGWEYNFHGGHISPYRSMMSLFPSQNLGIFTSTNEGPGYVESDVVHKFIFEILRGTSYQDAIGKLDKLWKNVYDTKVEEQRMKDKNLEKFLNKLGEEPVTNSEDEVVGKYGSAVLGDAEILKKLNSETNKTGLYVQYGKWGRGWMERIGGSTYKIIWDTDVIQEFYSNGDSKGRGYVGVTNKTLQFFFPGTDKLEIAGNFTRGFSLADLPTIPWDPNSC